MAKVISLQAYKLKKQLEKLEEAAKNQSKQKVEDDYDFEAAMEAYRRRKAKDAYYRSNQDIAKDLGKKKKK